MKTRKEVLEMNKRYSENYVYSNAESKLDAGTKELILKNGVNSVIELGPGGGGFIRAVKKEFPEVDVFGVDISPSVIKNLEGDFEKKNLLIGDVCDTKIKKKFDMAHSSQVIEHVPNDKKMIKEMARLLKPNGILICSSVIKKPWAIYKYRCNGRFALAPTHVREYRSHKDFLDLFRDDFKLIRFWVKPVYRKVFGLSVEVPGFYSVGGVWRKRD